MSYYKCGHGRKPVFMKKNVVAFAQYLVWKESTGFEGDKSQCWSCFCKELNENKKVSMETKG